MAMMRSHPAILVYAAVLSDCANGEDEANCNHSGGTWCEDKHGVLIYVYKKQMCSNPVYSHCVDNKDQVNCSMVALTCTVNGSLSTVSDYAVCDGYPICADHLDEECEVAPLVCSI